MLSDALTRILDPQNWAQGLTIMVVAMGIVFSFLMVLVIAMNVMTKCIMFINKIWPEKTEEPKQKAKVNDESEIALAISIARAKA